MPIAGLHEVIVNVLESLSATHKVKTWNVFYEENTDITVRLKFSSSHVEDLVQGHSNTHTGAVCRTVSYRRKSPKQIARDNERLENHNKGVRSNKPERLFTNQETQVSSPELEIYRTNGDHQQTQSILCRNESPVIVEHSLSKSENISDLNHSGSQESFDIPAVATRLLRHK